MRGLHRSGFTVIEILVVLTILALLGGAMISFVSSKSRTHAQTIANEIAFALEEAKADALAGRNGEAHGVHVEMHSYTLFSGDTYNASDSSNVVKGIDSQFQLSSTFSNDTVVFARLTGNANAGSITVSHVDGNGAPFVIYVGVLGDVRVAESS